MHAAARVIAQALAVLSLSACISTGTVAPRQYFLLEDVIAKAPPPGAPIDRALLVNGIASDAFYENRSLVYSRAPGQRAYYQFASWTDQPARRIALLTERRLEARDRFRSVAPIDSGARGDLLLTVTVDELLHDAATSPGTGRVVLTAELLQRSGRRILARERFVSAAPAPSADAEGAVAAMNTAVSTAIDAVVAWVEDAAARSVQASASARPG
jgi:cholesterol transport system auxiliary component